jgi:hypothetical protein
MPAAGAMGIQSDTLGHAVKPGCETRGPAQRAGLAGEDEEGGLKGILRRVNVAEHAPAQALHHRAVTLHQRPKRGLVALPGITVQQLRVGVRRIRDAVQLGHDPVQRQRHEVILRGLIDLSVTLLSGHPDVARYQPTVTRR